MFSFSGSGAKTIKQKARTPDGHGDSARQIRHRFCTDGTLCGIPLIARDTYRTGFRGMARDRDSAGVGVGVALIGSDVADSVRVRKLLIPVAESVIVSFAVTNRPTSGENQPVPATF